MPNPREFEDIYRKTFSASKDKDVVQDAFLKLLTAKNYDERGLLPHLAARVVRNTWIDARRKRKDLPLPHVTQNTTVQATDRQRETLLQRIEAAEQLLPECTRSVIGLHYHQGLPYKKIARLSGVNINTLLARSARGIRQIKSILEKENSDD